MYLILNAYSVVLLFSIFGVVEGNAAATDVGEEVFMMIKIFIRNDRSYDRLPVSNSNSVTCNEFKHSNMANSAIRKT